MSNTQIPTKGIGLGLVRASGIGSYKVRNYLLAIAINDYDHQPKLYNCVKDAEDLIVMLTENFEFEREYVRFVCSGTLNEDFQDVVVGRKKDDEFQAARGTREVILKEITRMREKVTADQEADKNLKVNLILFFSGHGWYDEDLDLGYWITVNAQSEDYANFISNSDIRDHLNSISTHHTLLIADSCFSGSLFISDGNRSTTAATRLEQDPSRWGITSGGNEVVSDGQLGTNSPFMAFLLEKLGVSEVIPVEDLCVAVRNVVAANALQTPKGEPLRVRGHKGGQFVFRKKAHAGKYYKAGLALLKLAAHQPEYERYRSAAYQFGLARRATATKHKDEAARYHWWEARALSLAGSLEAAIDVLEGAPQELESPALKQQLRQQLGFLYFLQSGYQEEGAVRKEALQNAKKQLHDPGSKEPSEPIRKVLGDFLFQEVFPVQDPRFEIILRLFGPQKFHPIAPKDSGVINELLNKEGIILSYTALVKLARAFARAGTHQLASDYFKRALAISPEDAGEELEAVRFPRWKVLLELAQTYQELGLPQQAVITLDHCLEEAIAMELRSTTLRAIRTLRDELGKRSADPKRALLIGIDQYKSKDIEQDFTGENPAEKDVLRWKTYLMESGYAEENITILLNEKAKRRVVINEFKSLAEQAVHYPAFFFFAGKGVSDAPDPGLEGLVVYDSQTTEIVNEEERVIGFLPFWELAQLSTQAKNLTVLIDAGFNDEGPSCARYLSPGSITPPPEDWQRQHQQRTFSGDPMIQFPVGNISIVPGAKFSDKPDKPLAYCFATREGGFLTNYLIRNLTEKGETGIESLSQLTSNYMEAFMSMVDVEDLG